MVSISKLEIKLRTIIRISLLIGIPILSLSTVSFAADMERTWLGLKVGAISPQNINDQPGIAFGGTILNGFRGTNFALEAELSYLKRYFGSPSLKTSTVDFSIGSQYRFNNRNIVTPYLQAGADYLLNNASNNYKIENSFGGHVAVGFDFFPDNYNAVNVELKQTIAMSSAITNTGVTVAHFNPSNLALTLGLRFW